MVRPDAKRQLTIHEPAFTEAHEAEDFPAADPIAADDIGHHDHVEDGAVLPQLEHSELISIGHPLTPIAQDASWVDRPQEEEDFEAQPTPTTQASPALRRLCKGPRSPVSASEAETAEDIPAASADEEETPRVATPPSHQEAVLEENVTVTDPPARQVEVENLEAATTNTNEATDVVMDEANVEPSPTKAPEVSKATDPTASIPAPAAGPQFDYHVEHMP